MAGKGKFAPQQNSNSLVTGVIIFLLFVLGVWLFATPTQKIMDDAILKFDANLETENDHKVAVESRQVASKSSATSEPAPKDAELLSFTKFSDNPDLSTQDKESKIQKDFASHSPVEESTSPVPSSSKSSASSSSSSSSSSSTSSNPDSSSSESSSESSSASSEEAPTPLSYSFPLCDSRDDVIPCLDNEKAIKALTSTAHYEHRERHCPASDEKLRCVLPLPEGYKPHINWPDSRDQIWYSNVPKPSLANYKADQNWVKAEGDKFVFPGGGTQFKFGATKYIEWLQESFPQGLSWGKHLRVGLDMGCGVASFAAYLDPFDVRMMSVAPKDEHDAQIQFALERGVSALVGVMGTMRQPYPANVFDAVHCARCRVPWHADGGRLLLELNRLIRPGGYFVWSATPVCPECKASEPDDAEVWAAMSDLTKKICWKRVQKTINAAMGIGVAIWQKPVDNECYEQRGESATPPMCEEGDSPDAAWYVPMQSCIHKVPTSGIKQHGAGGWPTEGTDRLKTVPAWLKAVKKGVYGQPAYDEFKLDTENWERVAKTYFTSAGIDWETVRNVMDMDAHYGGLGAALAQKPAWSMNVVPVGKNPDTLPAIFDRGLLGIYHDWCESFNTYPRTYDLLHADHLLGKEIKANRCDVADIMLEMDRILRPQGYVVLRESARFLPQIEAIAAALHWEVKKSYKQESEAMITYQKTMWRPTATS